MVAIDGPVIVDWTAELPDGAVPDGSATLQGQLAYIRHPASTIDVEFFPAFTEIRLRSARIVR
jgi:hypothetical protein